MGYIIIAYLIFYFSWDFYSKSLPIKHDPCFENYQFMNSNSNNNSQF
jgi:hypothetical protein